MEWGERESVDGSPAAVDRCYVVAPHIVVLQSSGRTPGQGVFDPLKQRATGPAPPLAEKSDNSPEDLAREMEKQVNRLIEASADAALQGDTVQALERAKEAVSSCTDAVM